MHSLETERLLLRPLTRQDFRALHSLYGDEELMRYIIGRARTPLETRARLKKDIRLHRDFGFGLCLGLERATGALVGRYGLEPREGGRTGELAWMTRRDLRGVGLATEAGRALIEYGTRELGLSRIFAETHPGNEASIRVMDRLGLVLEFEDERTLRFAL